MKIIVYTTKNCFPCKIFKKNVLKVLKVLKSKYKIDYEEINIEELEENKKWISGFPAWQVVKNGEIVYDYVGAISLNRMLEKIKEFL